MSFQDEKLTWCGHPSSRSTVFFASVIHKQRVYGATPSLLHAFIRSPRALQLAHVDDLSDMIGIVGADISDGGRPLCQLLVVGGFDKFLEVGHHLVELGDGVFPLLVVEFHEGLVVVAGVFIRRPSLELDEGVAIPEQQMIGQLAGGVAPGGRLPAGLLGGESVNRRTDLRRVAGGCG
jgi:hypothetical protein